MDPTSSAPRPRCGYACKGNCCRFTLVPLYDEDHARWAFLHGMRVFRFATPAGIQWRALVEGHPCSKLTEGGKCAVYGTAERPRMCGEYWCEQAPEYEEVKF